jgi:hypothetical protein
LYIYPSFFFNFILFCFGISITSCHWAADVDFY